MEFDSKFSKNIAITVAIEIVSWIVFNWTKNQFIKQLKGWK